MPEDFLRLPAAEQADIYITLAQQLGRRPEVLEKDVWVCWTLGRLFSIAGRPQMAFKGGTSLSKVYGAIHRFSEDIDLTLDYRGVEAGFDPVGESVSRSRRKRFRETAELYVQTFAKDQAGPHLQAGFAQEFAAGTWGVAVSASGEKIRVQYPSALAAGQGYVGQSVLVELGARNITEPSQMHTIAPDIAPPLKESGLRFPEAEVQVLSGERTFWEKATLIHSENGRTEVRESAERLSRHWYDLSMLAGGEIGRNALADRRLLEAVVKHKKALYEAPHSAYDLCVTGGMRIIPHSGIKGALERDYEAMIAARMFFAEPPTFDEILVTLATLEAVINDSAGTPGKT